MKPWGTALTLLVVAAVAAAGVYALWDDAENEWTEVPVPEGVSPAEAYLRAVTLMTGSFRVERAVENGPDGMGVIYTGWTDRVAGRRVDGGRVRAMVLMRPEAREARLVVETEAYEKGTPVARADAPLTDWLAAEMATALATPRQTDGGGLVPAPPRSPPPAPRSARAKPKPRRTYRAAPS